MAPFQKIQSSALIESVEQQLMAKIFSGELKPGDRLPTERELAEQFDISRSSVHQAIMALESQGLLSVRPRHGILINDFRKNPTPQSLETLMSYSSLELEYSLFSDMMDTRVWLETECARRACTHIYDSTLQEMKAMVEQMEQDNADLTDLIYRFHHKLTVASGNSMYSMIFRAFEPVLRNMIHYHYSVRGNDLTTATQMRRRLLDAIEAKEEETAAALVKQIITQGIDALEMRYQETIVSSPSSNASS